MRFVFSAGAPAVLIATVLVGACSQKVGDRQLNSRFVYAESDVTPLQNTSASKELTGILNCSFSRTQFNEVYDEALGKVTGANVLLDYDVTYTTTIFPIIPICTNELVISGLAANAVVE
ncbi:MAG: hypothetical protein AAFN27_18575 [Pseudomonadota bacterium]